MAPSHSSCEWHSDPPTVWILHVLAAGALVPSIYFYFCVLSLHSREGRSWGKVQVPFCGDHLGSHGGNARTVAAALVPALLLRGSVGESREL